MPQQELFDQFARLSAAGVYTVNPGPGSADSFWLAQLLPRAMQDKRLLAVVAATAQDAQRITDELRYLAPAARIHLLPDWETLPYDAFSPHQDLISERLATLHQTVGGEIDVLITAATTSLHVLCPPAFIEGYTFHFKQGQKLDEAKLRAQLLRGGYAHVNQVLTPGEYSVRGSLIDLFPMGAATPYRMDLFDNEIETIRAFDPDTQRSIYPTKEVRLLPGREFPMDEESRTNFRKRFREAFEGDPSKSAIYKDMGSGVPAAGIEYYLPLFFEQSARLFDYLPEHTCIVTVGDVNEAITRFHSETLERYKFLRADKERPLLPPEKLFLKADEWFTRAQSFARLAFNAQSSYAPLAEPVLNVAVDRKKEVPMGAFADFCFKSGLQVVVVAESAGRKETIGALMRDHELVFTEIDSISNSSPFKGEVGWGMGGGTAPSATTHPHPNPPLEGEGTIWLTTGPLAAGFILREQKLAIITETELYQASPRAGGKRRQEATTNIDLMIRDLAELKIGDPVVHAQHGIGRYLGLTSMDLGDGQTEFLHLEYQGGTKLYVPVSQLHVIGRYSGANPDDAPLHMLGSGQWEKARKRAAQQARDTAAELLDLYAKRALRKGHAFMFDPQDYAKFADGFGFEETADQAAAIAAVMGDMTRGKPMDRLVCGDVGFGKTEVALRAAFMAVAGGKQVAILAPTTLLAEQHFQTLSDRFANWPVSIVELSRFKTAKEVKEAVERINAGKVDIVVGTHKLLSSDVKYPRLGLVIIDEEHRFGVRHKEQLKTLRAEVDILTLTATPIPRTLGMSLEGMRDLSVIATAPQRRLAIKTFVRREGDSIIREAVLRELKRGGQVYFLHNEVETIENRRAKLTELLPEARIAVAHGQMPERELERVMREFYQQRHNILLCTTIIETGIDVPTANTIIIHRSDKFGLAQLHQLRGRVGRSHHQAYAYLLVHGEDSLTKQAKQRLDAIQQMEELGSGFYLAMHDLEIRGAGEVLGEKQSGEMAEVGFQMYMDMINEAVRAMKRGETPNLDTPFGSTVEVNLHIPALLPADYCPDVHERLSLYKRLSSAEDNDAVAVLGEEIIDRFGKMPEQTVALIETHKLRILAKALGITKVDAHGESITLQFGDRPPIEPYDLIMLIQKNRHIKMQGQDKLRITAASKDLAERVSQTRTALKLLAGIATQPKEETASA
ncbi:MAG: transcription-repair coupling factor [Burkholderiaceae bacterium]